MVQWVTVLDAEVSATAFTGQFHHFPLPAARAFTLIGVDLRVGRFVTAETDPFSNPTITAVQASRHP